MQLSGLFFTLFCGCLVLVVRAAEKCNGPLNGTKGLCTCGIKRYTSCREVTCTGKDGHGDFPDVVSVFANTTCRLDIHDFESFRVHQNAWGLFKDLKKLELSNVSIIDADNVFSNIPRNTKQTITSLHLPFNSIKNLSEHFFEHFVALTLLSLRQNNIESLVGIHFVHLPKLQILELQNNNLIYLESGHFLELKSLKTLHLEHNKLDSIHPDAFKGLDNLEVLFMNFNWLTVIEPGTFTLPNLQTLNLEFNKFQILTKSIVKAPLLKSIELAHNQFEVIQPDAIPNLIKINSWHIHYNNLASIPDAVIDNGQFSHYQHPNLIFEGNPLVCDCRIIQLWLLLKHFNTSIQSIGKNLTCEYPPGGQKVIIVEQPLSNLNCNDNIISKESCNLSTNNSANAASCKILKENLCNKKDSQQSCLCSNKECFVCPEHYYGVHHNESLKCTPCPHLKNGGYGAQFLHECQCIPWYEEKENSCQECPKNTSKREIGAQRCSHCSTNSEIWNSTTRKCTCLEGYSLSINGTCQGTIVGKVENVFENNLRPQTQLQKNVNDATSHDTVIIITACCSGLIFLGILFAVLLHRQAFKSKLKRHDKEHEFTMSSMLQNVSLPHAIENSYVNSDSFNGLMVELNQIKFEQLLGQGAFGLVHKATVTGLKNEAYTSTAAIKTLRAGHTEEDKTALYTELQQLLYVGHHPNIINLLGFVSTNETFMLIIEYASHGDLLSYLKGKTVSTQYTNLQFANGTSTNSYLDMQNSPYMQPNLTPTAPDGEDRSGNNCVDLKTLLAIAWQVTKGMNHLAEMKCIHRDLAGRNVLLSTNLVAKVSDFGLARAVYECGYYFKETKGRLPFKWMPLEAIMEGQYTTKSDVWSFGILLWEIFTLGGNPYPGVPIKSLLDLLQSGYRMGKPSNCPADVYEIMTNCWHERPAERPSFQELADSLDKILQKTEYMEVHESHNVPPEDNEDHPTPYDCLLRDCPSEDEVRVQPMTPVKNPQYARLLIESALRRTEGPGLLS